MATIKRNAGNQDYTNNADGFDITGGTTRRKLTATGADITLNGSGTNTYTFPASTSTLWGDDRIKIVTLSSNYTNATTGMVGASGFTTTLGAGTYTFRFMLLVQTDTAANSFKFAVNHTGTTTSFVYTMFFPSAGVVAATGAVDQSENVTTGNVWATHTARAKNTTLGPQTGVDTTNADIMIQIDGIAVITVSGNFELYGGCEQAGTMTVKAGSSVVIMKVA